MIKGKDIFYTRDRNYLLIVLFRRGICSYTKHLPAANIKCNQYNAYGRSKG